MDVGEFQRVYQTFEQFHSFYAMAFGHKQWRERRRNYLQALLVQSEERRNAENLSESVEVSAPALQRFLTEARWDDDAVIGCLQEYLGSQRRHLGERWTVATSPSRAGSPWEWRGSTAGRTAQGSQLPGGDVPGLCQPVGTGVGGQTAESASELDLGQRAM